MCWILYKKSPPPKFMCYGGCEKQVSKIGDTLAMVWLRTLKTPFPNWMRYEGIEE